MKKEREEEIILRIAVIISMFGKYKYREIAEKVFYDVFLKELQKERDNLERLLFVDTTKSN